MLGKLFSTPRGTRLVNLAALVVGIVLVIAVDKPRTGTIVFLAATSLESGLFSLIYGLRSQWHRSAPARAVFWAILAYWGVATHTLTLYLWSARFFWTNAVRELLYLGLALAGLNLVLTVVRVLRREPAASA